MECVKTIDGFIKNSQSTRKSPTSLLLRPSWNNKMTANNSENCGYDVVSTSFPKEICYIDAQINSLLEVHLDPRLLSVNLHCNNISVIENLDRLQHLKHLDLSSNRITRMQGLGGLMSLKTLNLSCNELRVVEGLDSLRSCFAQFLFLKCCWGQGK